jgi:uncharacterized protein YndB with AHSA1/START domain
MVISRRRFDAPPEDLWEVVTDAQRYPSWLVGARHVDAPQRRWPRVGASFDHQVGMGPVEVHDRTTVLRSEPPRALELIVRARPLLRATVLFELQAEGTGTLLQMDERPVGRFRLIAPLIAPLVKLRNDRSLAHLSDLVDSGS